MLVVIWRGFTLVVFMSPSFVFCHEGISPVELTSIYWIMMILSEEASGDSFRLGFWWQCVNGRQINTDPSSPAVTSENRSSLPPEATTTNSISVLTDTIPPQRAHSSGAAVNPFSCDLHSESCNDPSLQEELRAAPCMWMFWLRNGVLMGDSVLHFEVVQVKPWTPTHKRWWDVIINNTTWFWLTSKLHPDPCV